LKIKKNRLDALLVERGLTATIQKARALIGSGVVIGTNKILDKAGMQVRNDIEITIKEKPCPFVSRGGLKLAKGLDYFNIQPAGLICADIGASTGGFTDCLLQNNARKVYAVDVGYGQLDWSLRNHKQVVVLERTNARHLTEKKIPEKIDLAVIDAAFISITLLIPALIPLFRKNKVHILSLIKPQFEVEKGKIGTGGVVRDPALHQAVITSIINFIKDLGLQHTNVTDSPILGPKGNKEFLIEIISP
jgi:23S rRNA (cytidine1920-2'-O)/16S rRNA (cytidine1409-2'-O)-methyltransferase